MGDFLKVHFRQMRRKNSCQSSTLSWGRLLPNRLNSDVHKTVQKLVVAPFNLFVCLFVFSLLLMQVNFFLNMIWAQFCCGVGWWRIIWLVCLAGRSSLCNSVVYEIIKRMLCQSGIGKQQTDSVPLFSTSDTIEKKKSFFMYHCMWKKTPRDMRYPLQANLYFGALWDKSRSRFIQPFA